jgi:NAD(P)-dependent dehydrogenase (short-subunit alcohol dehydrogenase family)
MKTLVVGATGSTGKQLVKLLLKEGNEVKAIVRPHANIPDTWKESAGLTVIRAHINDIQTEEMSEYLADCQAAASCLGHNLTWKGVYGKPRKLVTDAVELICRAIKKNKPATPVKFILMNTAGNRNRDLNEQISNGEKIVVGLIRLLLPPHVDNEQAADHLRVNIGQNDPHIRWVVVRPDGLINDDQVSEYEIHSSPTRSAIFNAGETSRINVGNFMARLITDQNLLEYWIGRMPVIYNSEGKV